MIERRRPRLPAVKCPACGSGALVRTSYDVSDTVREVRFECVDYDECGHVFVGQIAVIRTIRPSIKTNPRVILPLRGEGVRRPPLPVPPEPPPMDLMMAATG